MSRSCLALLLLPATCIGEDFFFGAVSFDRFEHQFESEQTVLDMRASYGTDRYQWAADIEAEYTDDDVTGELQLLYLRPLSPYFDLQVGVGVSDGIETESALIAGLQGLARYRIEVEAQLSLTEHGNVGIDLEAERDFLLTNQWVLQPRIEISAESGNGNAQAGLRLRYEVSRKLSPYFGIAWRRSFGDEADALQLAGIDESETTALAGVSFWF